MNGSALAQAAAELVGSRFRLHGRNPATGLDCIGVLAAALEEIGRPAAIPSGYPLRLRHLDGWLPAPAALGFMALDDAPIEPGDAMLLSCPPSQFHLVIAASDGGFVHAHAGLRRVVQVPILPPGRVLAHWRLSNRS